jgi:putative endonuclease
VGKAKRKPAAAWFVYMIECAGDRIYTGIAVDVAARFEKHCNGRGAAFTRINKPVRVLAAMPCGSQGDATREEYALKQLLRAQKLQWATKWAWPKT